MKKKPAFTEKADHESREWTVAVSASVLLHIGLCIMIVFFSHNFNGRTLPLKAIDVDLSYLPAPKGKPEPKAPAPSTEKPVSPKKAVKPVSKPAPEKKISISPKKKAVPVKAKKENPQDAIDKAIKRLEKDLATSPKSKTDPIADRIKRLETETGNQEPMPQARAGEGGDTPSDSAYDVSLIDRYRHNVGMEIREKWAFSENLAAGQKNLVTKVTFEVMPDGEIRGVRITRRSGNDYMDSSATMAIVKASPVRPHPPGLNKPFIEVKLEFTPEGLD